jgi:hypothetical protein
MAFSSPYFALTIVGYISLILLIASLLLEVAAFIHCAVQRGEAFQAVGTLPKGAWLAILGGTAVFTWLFSGSAINLIGLIGVGASAVYLLDVRPAIRDAVDGHGPW